MNVSCMAASWPRTATVAPRGGVPGAGDRLVHVRQRTPEVVARHIRGQRHHALAVDPVVFADDGRVLDAGKVAEERLRGVSRVTGTTRRSSSVVICGCGTCTCT